jgi:hypothetical protein
MLKPHFFEKVINSRLLDDRKIINESLIGIFLFRTVNNIYVCQVILFMSYLGSVGGGGRKCSNVRVFEDLFL